MQNENMDLQNLKRIKFANPLFDKCQKAIPSHKINYDFPDFSDLRKTFSYLVIPHTVQMDERLFGCKSLCPIFNANNQSFILTRGQNLWDFYRAKKENELILTEEQIWVLIKQVTQALMQLHSFGYRHTHLKQYAIYRQSPFCYTLMYHPHMRSMWELSRRNEFFYWYDFYLSPEQLEIDPLEEFLPTGKEAVFSLGLLLLNVMNADDFNRTVYSKTIYEVDWNIVTSKIDAIKRKYSIRLIDLVKNCLKQYPQQRYGFREVLNDTIAAIHNNSSLNLQFKSKFDQIQVSKFNHAPAKISPFSDSDSRQKQLSKSDSKTQSPKSSKKYTKILVTSKQKQINKSKISAELQKKISSLDSPPKKWKVSPVTQKKPFSISKPQFTIYKRYQIHKDGLRKKQSLQQQRKSPQKHEDIINFQRGTFGGDQASSFISNKFKKHPKIQIQSNQTESWKDEQKCTLPQSKVDNFETERMITFGQMKSEQGLNQSNSQDSLDSQIYILDSARKKERQNEYQSENPIKNVEKQVLPAFPSSLQKEIPLLKQQQKPYKGYTLEQLRASALIMTEDKRLARIESSLQSQAQKITLNLKDCLQPLETLQTEVSNSHGVYIEGNLYFGPFQHGRRNGFGLQIFPQNQYYLGNFKDDLFQGEGFYFWNKNQYFLGLFQNGKKVFGHLFAPKLHYSGQFSNSKKMNGFGKAKFKNGEEYIGEWMQGRRNGIGKLTQITKDHFIGHWSKGKRAGYGEHISCGYPQQGYCLKAFWKDSDIISEVIIEYDNENLYEGSLNEELQKHGKGNFVFKKGGYFKGTFYKDNATHGELVYKNGEKYIGSLKNMKRHGFGEYHYLDGTAKKGNWIEDIRIQKQTNSNVVK